MKDGMGKLHKTVRNLLIAGLVLVKVLATMGCGGNASSALGNQTATPAFSPGGGTYKASQTVTISDATASAVLYCTTDGTTPTTSSPQCSQPTTVFKSEFLQAIAVAPGKSASTVASAGYTIDLNAAATPSFSPTGGTYTSAQNVTINDATTGANIYYTTDGSVPSASSSTLYTGSITVSKTETLSAIAVASGYDNSGVASATYAIGEAPAATPTFSPGTGTYTSSQQVTINDATPGAVIYYTTDGVTVPTATPSEKFNGTINVSASEVVQAIAVANGYSNSAVAVAAYAVNLTPTAAPTFSTTNPPGEYTSVQQVTINDTTPGAVIYYTTDGITQPTPIASEKYTGVFTVSSTETIMAIAVAPGYANSGVLDGTYTINLPIVATPTFSITNPPGQYLTAQQVTISDTTPSAVIYYTTDGITQPTPIASEKYTGVFTVSSTETIMAIAVAPGYANSAVLNGTYTIGTSGTVINGAVKSGTLPISGATVKLFVAGTAGTYGAGSSAINSIPATVTTGANGQFALGYTCPSGGAPNDQMYLVATGGDSGSGANSGITLMAALGTCSKLPSSVTVNEVTTVASAYALSAFATINTSGGSIEVGAPANGSGCTAADNWQSTSPDTCNYTGLVNAFNTVGNLVDLGTGAALSITPGYANGNTVNGTFYPQVPHLNSSTVPQARINALADMLASCVESNGSGCGTGLFSAAATTGASTPITPVDTLQAALNIAQNPGSNGINVNVLLGLIPASNPPYATTLSTAESTPPTDLTLALTFTGAGLGIAPNITLSDGNIAIVNGALGIDATGNIWVAAYRYNANNSEADGEMLAEFNALGVPLTPVTTLSSASPPVATYGGYDPEPSDTRNYAGLQMLAIDPSGYLWTYDGGANVLEISSSPSLSVLNTISNHKGTPANIAIDAYGDAWYWGAPAVEELLANGNAGVEGVTVSGTVLSLNYLAFDSNGGLWAAGDNLGINADIYQLSTSNGSISYDAFPSSTSGQPVTLAADGAGNIYGCDPTGLNLDVFSAGALASSNPITPATGRACGTQLVLDGQGHLFAVLVNGFSYPFFANIDEFTTRGTLISPTANGYTGTSSTEAPTLNPDASGNTPASVPGIGAAMDGSGNLWVLNPDTDGTDASGSLQPGNVLVEYVGIGAPVVTPTSLALKNGLLGARP
jgi:hypothetical protein